MTKDSSCCVCRRALNVPVAALVLVALPLLALASALIAQYGFGHPPCELCLWQRGAYLALAVVAAVAWGLRKRDGAARGVLAGAALVALVGAGIAFFHVGVQMQWWPGTDSCALKPLHAEEGQSLVDALLSTPVVRCDRIDLTILGLSLPMWNVPAFLALGLFALLAAIVRGDACLCRCLCRKPAPSGDSKP